MSGWRRQAETLRYDGETVRETVDLGDAGVVVTSHRLLAFTPEGDGPNFREVDRPNVAAVDAGSRARDGLLRRALRYGATGAVLVVVGRSIDLGGAVGDVGLGESSQVGLGGIAGTLGEMLALLGRIDDLLVAAGAFALALAALLAGGYLLTRDRTLHVEVAGGEDIHLPRPDTGDATERIERALGADEGPTPRGPHDEP